MADAQEEPVDREAGLRRSCTSEKVAIKTRQHFDAPLHDDEEEDKIDVREQSMGSLEK